MMCNRAFQIVVFEPRDPPLAIYLGCIYQIHLSSNVLPLLEENGAIHKFKFPCS